MRLSLKKIFFTPVGFAVLIIAIIMLIRALAARNAYEVVLSFAALLLLLVLGVIGYRASRKLAELEPGWKPPYPFTACAGEPTVISGLEANIPLFFRLHFEVKGNYYPSSAVPYEPSVRCRRVRNYFAETSIARGESSAILAMDFPMSGVFHGEGICKLRDIFGFFSFRCGQSLHRALNIRCAPCFGKEYYINAQSGAEDKRNKHSADEERYYMREYTPGDRLRDINWKSSEKIDTLITRISPDNQEKVSRIEVYFRNYGNTHKPSLEELWLLDRAKARLAHFLRSLQEQQSSFIFDVRVAGTLENFEIEDEEDLDEFLETLAGIGFVPPQNESPVSTKAGEMYVFSTALDLGLQSFLLANQLRTVSLFLVRYVSNQSVIQQEKITNNKPAPDPRPQAPEILYKRDFILKGIILKLKWLKHAKIKPMTVQTAKTEIIYAGTKL